LNAALTIALFSGLVRFASVGKELFVAWRFGTSDDLDAFLISILVPVAIVTILANAASASFIPVYIETRHNEGSASAQKLFQSVIGWGVVLLLILIALVVIAARWYLPILGSGFGAGKLQLTFKLLWWNSLVIVLGGMAAVFSSALNAERQFAVTSAAPLCTPVLTVILLWIAPGSRAFSLTAGLIAGASVELLLLAIAARGVGLGIYPRWPHMDPKIRRLAGQFAPVISGAILTSGNVVVDQAMAAMLATGSVAALNYGNRVVQFPLALLSAPLGTALMPYLSQLAAARDWVELKHTARRYIGLSLAIGLPLTAGLIVFARPIVSLLFHRGAFTDGDALQVSRIQTFYALQIPAYLVSMIMVRLISSIQANQFLLIAAIINLLTNIILNFVFMHWMGLPGIALSTSMVYLLSTIFCYAVAVRRLRRLSTGD
jgi:putative peptidoglycan lipid II flippase